MKNECSTEIEVMRTAVRGFKWTTPAELRALIDELDVRASRVRGRDGDWDNRFREQWEALEEVYAVMADRSMPEPDATLNGVVSSAIDNLKLILRG